MASTSSRSGTTNNNTIDPQHNADGKTVIGASAAPETDQQKIERYKQQVRQREEEIQSSLNDHGPPGSAAATRSFLDHYTGGLYNGTRSVLGALNPWNEGSSYSERMHNLGLYHEAESQVDQEDHPIAGALGGVAGELTPSPPLGKLARLFKWARRGKRGESIKRERREGKGDPRCSC